MMDPGGAALAAAAMLAPGRTMTTPPGVGAPVCGECCDTKWRKTEDGVCDPPFDEIKHWQSGEWIGAPTKGEGT